MKDNNSLKNALANALRETLDGKRSGLSEKKARLSANINKSIVESIQPESQDIPSDRYNHSPDKVNIPPEFTWDFPREAPLAHANPDDYEVLDFADPVSFAMMFDPQLSTGKKQLYQWQVEFLLWIASNKFSDVYPLELQLVAANGSGKDEYCLGWAITWLICCKKRSRTVVTTRDFGQMMTQTYTSISGKCRQVNKKLRELGIFPTQDFVRIRQGHITCEKSGSEIIMFVTDEANRAEGYHPFADYEKSELSLFYNEAKSVDDDIFSAGHRCRGFSRFVCVSSTGSKSGYFYNKVKRSILYPAQMILGKPYTRIVTSYECKHIDPIIIERDRETLPKWLFESTHESKFYNIEGNFCIPENFIDYVRDNPTQIHHDKGKFGISIDPSLGGDKTVVMLAEGNKVLLTEEFQISDTTKLTPALAIFLRNLITKYSLTNENCFIIGDAGGVGKPILQALSKLVSIKIIFRYFNSPAREKRIYGAGNIEDYFHARLLLAKRKIIFWNNLTHEKDLTDQLISRRYETRAGKLYLEAKIDLKARNEPSPDYADCFVMLFRKYLYKELHHIRSAKTPEEALKYDEEGNEIPQESSLPEGQYDPKDTTFNFYDAIKDKMDSLNATLFKPKGGKLHTVTGLMKYAKSKSSSRLPNYLNS